MRERGFGWAREGLGKEGKSKCAKERRLQDPVTSLHMCECTGVHGGW